MTGYSTASNNLLTSDGTFNYQHDADGNQTVRTRISNAYATDYQTTFSWDYRNRLTDVESFDNNGVLTKHVHYVYDVFDHLLATEADTTGGGSYNQIEYYVLDVSPEIPSAGVPGTALAQPLLQFDGANNETIRYLGDLDRIFAEGAVSSVTQGDTATWMLTDNLGSVRYVVDNNGNVIDKTNYNSFGQVAYESNTAVHHFAGFSGGHLDVETGFVDDYHRWYDPATGRWISVDPDGFFGNDANLARYAGNDPTGQTDSTGLVAVPPWAPPKPPDGMFYTWAWMQWTETAMTMVTRVVPFRVQDYAIKYTTINTPNGQYQQSMVVPNGFHYEYYQMQSPQYSSVQKGRWVQVPKDNVITFPPNGGFTAGPGFHPSDDTGFVPGISIPIPWNRPNRPRPNRPIFPIFPRRGR